MMCKKDEEIVILNFARRNFSLSTKNLLGGDVRSLVGMRINAQVKGLIRINSQLMKIGVYVVR